MNSTMIMRSDKSGTKGMIPTVLVKKLITRDHVS